MTDPAAASAVAWALARVGERTYPLRCLAFVEDAYERANGIQIFGGASAAAGWTKPALIGWTSAQRVLDGHRSREWSDA